ncbi:MAG: hypothetical protein KatS3mg053_0101 [Candidatus Roseilinea sp.]|nr:MAG: hypothetical protein KatS3mg053_0101 [Candidatus Roseilinea sp.]
MPPITEEQLAAYIDPNIRKFHQAREERLSRLTLQNILLRKNPYLYRAKDIQTAEPFVRNILDAYLSSQEEGMFGSFLEGLAVYVCQIVYGGRKSAATGIDLEFERDDVYYIVAIKSGPNWGNSQQIARMLDNFKKAKTILRTNAPRRVIEAVNGCCYGREITRTRATIASYVVKRFGTSSPASRRCMLTSSNRSGARRANPTGRCSSATPAWSTSSRRNCLRISVKPMGA